MIAALLGEEDTIHSSVLPHNKQGGVPTLQLYGSKNMFDPFRQGLCILCDVVHMTRLISKCLGFTTQGLNPAAHLLAIHLIHGASCNQFTA